MKEITEHLDDILEHLGHFKHLYCRRIPSNPTIDIDNLVCTYTAESSYAMNRAELAGYIVDFGKMKYLKPFEKVDKFDTMNNIISNHTKELSYFLEEYLK